VSNWSVVIGGMVAAIYKLGAVNITNSSFSGKVNGTHIVNFTRAGGFVGVVY
jgi:hypothetical protein